MARASSCVWDSRSSSRSKVSGNAGDPAEIGVFGLPNAKRQDMVLPEPPAIHCAPFNSFGSCKPVRSRRFCKLNTVSPHTAKHCSLEPFHPQFLSSVVYKRPPYIWAFSIFVVAWYPWQCGHWYTPYRFPYFIESLSACLMYLRPMFVLPWHPRSRLGVLVSIGAYWLKEKQA